MEEETKINKTTGKQDEFAESFVDSFKSPLDSMDLQLSEVESAQSAIFKTIMELNNSNSKDPDMKVIIDTLELVGVYQKKCISLHNSMRRLRVRSSKLKARADKVKQKRAENQSNLSKRSQPHNEANTAAPNVNQSARSAPLHKVDPVQITNEDEAFYGEL